jgi:hypothetical protein
MSLDKMEHILVLLATQKNDCLFNIFLILATTPKLLPRGVNVRFWPKADMPAAYRLAFNVE